jgi:hypothetical protein
VREVAIIGLGGGMADAPMSMERWGLPWSGDSGYDTYFEMHSTEVRPYTDAYKKKLRELEVPVFMQDAFDDVPNSRVFPKIAVERVGRYLESSISYMLAYAIFCHVPAVSIYGVGAPFDSHYVQQRSNLEYLIGFARGQGMDVTVSPNSELLQSHWTSGIYGFDKDNLRPGTEYVT